MNLNGISILGTIILTVVILFLPSSIYTALNEGYIGCGNQETSIVNYRTVDGTTCGELVEEFATESFYKENEGVWELVHVREISAQTAQKRCCNE